MSTVHGNAFGASALVTAPLIAALRQDVLRVVEATSPKIALNLARSSKFAVLIAMTITLPIMVAETG